MSRLAQIPIRIEGTTAKPAGQAACGGLGGGVAALLAELASLLERLASTQLPAAIDLHSLPMSALDRAELERVLGEGEVRATIQAQGRSMVRETRISGVWWVEHRSARGELTAELLEVAQVPAILASAPDEIAAAAGALRDHLEAGARAPGEIDER
ncbi:MAG TPA: hydrogenase expression/formation C-terminal domain-containing protein [Steroidobacteraceae bacterium]|nr:hydrogenase expression/formation C-terminal domain-containing protein [Steroidobacteraceae bacterium]